MSAGSEEDVTYYYEEAQRQYTIAEEYYLKTRKNPTLENFNLAREYAENASKLYALANDTIGVSTCQDLINRIKEETYTPKSLPETAEEWYNKAELNYLQGRRFIYEGEYELAYEFFKNASNYSKYAKADYVTLLNWSKDLTDGKQREEKVKFYSKKVEECEEQLEKINHEIDTIEKRRRAEELYKEATKLYGEGKCLYENASRLLNEAKEIFEEIGNWREVSKSNALIQSINLALEKKVLADSLYENATKSFQIADFKSATFYAEKAKEIYFELNCGYKVELCDSLLEKIEEGNESKAHADEFYDSALKLYDRGTFAKSNEYAGEAKEIYQQINHSEGISKCEELIEKNDEKLSRTIPSPRTILYYRILKYTIYSILIIALIFLAVKIFRKLRK